MTFGCTIHGTSRARLRHAACVAIRCTRHSQHSTCTIIMFMGSSYISLQAHVRIYFCAIMTDCEPKVARHAFGGTTCRTTHVSFRRVVMTCIHFHRQIEMHNITASVSCLVHVILCVCACTTYEYIPFWRGWLIVVRV